MKLIIAGGGTGGHLFPGIAVSKKLLQRLPRSEVLFLGSPKELDQNLVHQEGFAFTPIFQKPYPRTFFSLKGIEFALNSSMSLVKALVHVRTFRPHVVLGMGGYSSVPCVLAARMLRIPSVIFEPNVFPGKGNRFLAHFVTKIALGFEDGHSFFKSVKVVQTGIPIRESISGKTFGSRSPQDPFTLLIMGGSRGARALNELLVAEYPKLKLKIPNLKLIHITGKDDFTKVQEAYQALNVQEDIEVHSFIHHMESVLSRADVVVLP